MKKKPTLILSIGFIPKDGSEKVTQVVSQNFIRIKKNTLNYDDDYHLFYADDGSELFDDYSHEDDFKIIDRKSKNLPISYNCDRYIITPRKFHGMYAKGEIINFVAREIMPNYSHMILLDDDQEFLFEDSIIKFSEYFNQGYDFIIGRLIDPNGLSRHLFDNTVQGTTIGFSREVLDSITPLPSKILEWGAGEDSVLFHEAWRNDVKALYAGDIISIDRLSKRWAPSENDLNRITSNFHKGFESFYGLHPLKIPARRKIEWVAIKNKMQETEKLFSIASAKDMNRIYKGTFLVSIYTIFKLKILFFLKTVSK